ncbi:MAG: hypothetical protein GY750_19465 [Lentisphaerae bacterium]|nr:hypothetical protein [Lentisphaerota bacterium]MCP4103576.1 hypothetical protein [Lentisphaerota bacterium]
MRVLYSLSAAAMLISIVGCQTGPSEQDKQLTKSLNEMSQKLTEINKQLKEIKEEVKEEPLPLSTSTCSSFNRRTPKLRALRKIKLPSNPNRNQVREYIDKIIKVSNSQNCYSSQDPQVVMLEKIGSENVDLLINHANNFYVQYALPRIVTEKNKAQILEALKVYPNLITCVTKNNWTKDAKNIIFERLKNAKGYLSSEWIISAAELAIPKDYPVLEKYFIQGGNVKESYKALLQLDNFDMKKLISKVWNFQKDKVNAWQKKNAAIIAAQYGIKGALQYLIIACRIEKNQHSFDEMRATIFQLTGKTLAPKKMQKWYSENQKNLIFDNENDKYILKAKPVK